MEILQNIVLFIAGIIGGLYGGSVGGGALVTFPLLLMFGLSTPAAIATQRLGAIFLEASSSTKFYKEHKLDLKTGLLFGFIAATGGLIGSTITVAIDEKVLNLIVGIFFTLAVLMLVYETHLGLHNRKHNIKFNAPTSIMVFLTGVYGGFFGVAFGTLIMIVFLMNKLSYQNSAALARICGLVVSITSSIVFAYYGLIDYAMGISLGVGFAIGSWIGIDIALKKGSKYFKFLIIIVASITVFKLFSSFFNIHII